MFNLGVIRPIKSKEIHYTDHGVTKREIVLPAEQTIDQINTSFCAQDMFSKINCGDLESPVYGVSLTKVESYFGASYTIYMEISKEAVPQAFVNITRDKSSNRVGVCDL